RSGGHDRRPFGPRISAGAGCRGGSLSARASRGLGGEGDRPGRDPGGGPSAADPAGDGNGGRPMLNGGAQIIRPTWVEIDQAAIRANLRGIKALVGPERPVMAVIKAEAYGHGASSVAKLAQAEG